MTDDTLLRLRSFEVSFLDRILTTIEGLPPYLIQMIRDGEGHGEPGFEVASTFGSLLWEAGAWLRLGELTGELPRTYEVSDSSLDLVDGLFQVFHGQTAELDLSDLLRGGEQIDDSGARSFDDALLVAIEELRPERLQYVLITRQNDEHHGRWAAQLSELTERVRADPFLILRPDEADELAWLFEGYSSDVLDDRWPSSWRSNSALDDMLEREPGGNALVQARNDAERVLLDVASVWARGRMPSPAMTTRSETTA